MKRSGLPLILGARDLVRMCLNPRIQQALVNALEVYAGALLLITLWHSIPLAVEASDGMGEEVADRWLLLVMSSDTEN